MSILRSLVSGTRALFGKEQRNHEIDEELQGYFHAALEEKMRRGMDRGDAERAARVEMGSAAVVRHRIWS
ncbi:MAG: permease prefix domain 1-containing protein, partial [Terriglobales bacterium]